MQGEQSRPKPSSLETIGKRIARLRSEAGFTQQALAARLAISRVAVSHIEMDLTLPSERTVILLAGVFKLSPFALVDGTTYPQAKKERLPVIVCCYTPLEMEIGLLQNDLVWLEEFEGREEFSQRISRLLEKRLLRLENFLVDDLDEGQCRLLVEAQQKLNSLLAALGVRH